MAFKKKVRNFGFEANSYLGRARRILVTSKRSKRSTLSNHSSDLLNRSECLECTWFEGSNSMTDTLKEKLIWIICDIMCWSLGTGGGTTETSPGSFWEFGKFHKLSTTEKFENQTKLELNSTSFIIQNDPKHRFLYVTHKDT